MGLEGAVQGVEGWGGGEPVEGLCGGKEGVSLLFVRVEDVLCRFWGGGCWRVVFRQGSSAVSLAVM